MFGHFFVQGPLPAVAKGGMPDVMSETGGPDEFRQIIHKRLKIRRDSETWMSAHSLGQTCSELGNL
jgi:hypothetical protein